MLKLKILELFTKAYITLSGFFAYCLESKLYIVIIAAISAICLVASIIGKIIKAITKHKRF